MESLCREPPKYIGGYVINEEIGSGQFARVFRATHAQTNQCVAVKVISKAAIEKCCSMDKLYREIQIMKLLRHPNIVALIEAMEDDVNVYMVLELVENGALQTKLEASMSVSEDQLRRWTQQTVSALEYCHSHSVTHRDLKSDNLLLDKDNNIKIADFGLSSIFSDDQPLYTACGTPSHAAPELFLGEAYHGPNVDAWSLGVILYSAIMNREPFTGSSLHAIRTSVLEDELPPLSCASPNLQHLICGLLQKDPKMRLTIKQAFVHPWTTDEGRVQLLPYVDMSQLLKGSAAPAAAELHKTLLKKMSKLGYSHEEVESNLVGRVVSSAYSIYRLLETQLLIAGTTASLSKSQLKKLQEERNLLADQICEDARLTYMRQQELVERLTRSGHPLTPVSSNQTLQIPGLSASKSLEELVQLPSSPTPPTTPSLRIRRGQQSLKIGNYHDIVFDVDTDTHADSSKLKHRIKNSLTRNRSRALSEPPPLNAADQLSSGHLSPSPTPKQGQVSPRNFATGLNKFVQKVVHKLSDQPTPPAIVVVSVD